MVSVCWHIFRLFYVVHKRGVHLQHMAWFSCIASKFTLNKHPCMHPWVTTPAEFWVGTLQGWALVKNEYMWHCIMSHAVCFIHYSDVQTDGHTKVTTQSVGLSQSWRLYLITQLDFGLDHGTGLLDWISGMTFELSLCVPHDIHPTRGAELSLMLIS